MLRLLAEAGVADADAGAGAMVAAARRGDVGGVQAFLAARMAAGNPAAGEPAAAAGPSRRGDAPDGALGAALSAALAAAGRAGHAGVVELVLRAGARVERREHGNWKWDWLLEEQSTPVLELMLRAGADKDVDDCALLWVMSVEPSPDRLKVLVCLLLEAVEAGPKREQVLRDALYQLYRPNDPAHFREQAQALRAAAAPLGLDGV